MKARPAKGGGRWVSVPPERVHPWIDGFAGRHGPFEATGDERVVRLTAADGAVAELHVPFPPMRPGPPHVTRPAEHARAARRVGVVLVRLGGYAAGVFHGTELVGSKVGSRLVQGRTAAGGWSQQRFARRRDNQAGKAFEAAAETALRVLTPHLAELDAVVLGGDRKAVDALRADRRLAPVLALESGPFLDVPDPRLAVLRDTPAQFRAVRVLITDPS
ncbi:acVLRF1 family peptidyl-tRNA hydrolase [Nonomuraea sp. SBT364]|uniref:acVLRF1 family peptidyl-tRNA hydrolase n=1 Tax=Nonomuraea sp. SBT364 TaxID=1580530 RepID=UPI00066D7924|nr:acVLRF1 family peptidyl-tRNA hydrolase [Nonomuraea sp. SBT364]